VDVKGLAHHELHPVFDPAFDHCWDGVLVSATGIMTVEQVIEYIVNEKHE